MRRITKYLTAIKAKLLCNPFINSQFSYASIIWMFFHKQDYLKIAKTLASENRFQRRGANIFIPKTYSFQCCMIRYTQKMYLRMRGIQLKATFSGLLMLVHLIQNFLILSLPFFLDSSAFFVFSIQVIIFLQIALVFGRHVSKTTANIH